MGSANQQNHHVITYPFKLHETLEFLSSFSPIDRPIYLHPASYASAPEVGPWPSSIRQTAPKTRHRTMVPTWRPGNIHHRISSNKIQTRVDFQPLLVHQPNQSWIAKLCPFPFLQKLWLGCPTHPRDHHHPEQSKAHRPSKQIKGWITLDPLSSTPISFLPAFSGSR